jgi:hypothetical protein
LPKGTKKNTAYLPLGKIEIYLIENMHPCRHEANWPENRHVGVLL